MVLDHLAGHAQVHLCMQLSCSGQCKTGSCLSLPQDITHDVEAYASWSFCLPSLELVCGHHTHHWVDHQRVAGHPQVDLCMQVVGAHQPSLLKHLLEVARRTVSRCRSSLMKVPCTAVSYH